MTTAEWIKQAQNYYVWNIGQLEPETVRALNREHRAGRVSKSRELWCGLRMKTVWFTTRAA